MALYGYREDAESLHSTLHADLWIRRMIAYGAPRQTLIMLGFAMGQNSRERSDKQRGATSSRLNPPRGGSAMAEPGTSTPCPALPDAAAGSDSLHTTLGRRPARWSRWG